ncbi:MAG: histidine phosphatase family protein [Ruminococcaceae bacterium]|nr:histidine phosphatase family protein [Oscillospiraceae bacterium]
MKTFKLHLIRHGLTQGNLDGVYVGGGLDIPLCQPGIEQLQTLARQYRYPQVPVLFSSPMRRALQTAEILYPEMPERFVLEDLRENVFGPFEGRRVAELVEDEDFKRWMDPASDVVPEGAESGKAFSARTARALGTMLRYLIDNGIGAAVCVTHGGVIMSMLSQLALPRKPYPEWMADNGCGFTVQTSTAMLMRDGLVEVMGVVPPDYRSN